MNLNIKLIKFFIIFFIIFFNFKSFSKELIISGNDHSDDDVIISIIGDLPDTDNKSVSNYILKQLNKSGLFQLVEINYDETNYFVNVVEYPTVNKVIFENNKRIKDEQIEQLFSDLEINTLSNYNINIFIDELKKIYQSFGYNNIEIESKIENLTRISGDLYFIIQEGGITKIKNINFSGNQFFDNNLLSSKIQSKTKKITNIFANNNFKIYQVNDDLMRIVKFYKSEGYIDVSVNFEIEYFSNNKVNINFSIQEGEKYSFDSIKINNELGNKLIDDELNKILEKFNLSNKTYNRNKLDEVELNIAQLIESLGEQFFEIKTYEKLDNFNASVIFQILEAEPNYINQINISGNTRTYDYVIRREINIAEGDAVNDSQIKKISKKLNQLSLFETVDVNTNKLQDGTNDINIDVKESQTGSFNVGLSVGSLEGISFISGLKERNINGTGRSLEFLVNTSENNKAFTLSTAEKFILNNEINHSYAVNYKENDFTKSKSYKLNTFEVDTNFSYTLSEDLYHTFGIGYQLKDYIITNASTVSDSVAKSSGESISFSIKNQFMLNTLNSFIKPSSGNYLQFTNLIQTPSSSSNGYVKNLFTAKKYVQNNRNIYSAQARIGNIYSLNNAEILSDNKYSLGGRWLRGFDNFGAGPRNSRTDYVGGNNLIATKFDFSRPLSLNDQNPIYINFFNDYGLVWENKDSIKFSDNSLRSSYGFGINYYSPIGPIGFSWGFPLTDKEYDIKRMFMFTIGNLN